MNKTVEVHLMKNTFVLAFHDFPPTLKPSLHFFSKVSNLLLLWQFDIYINPFFPRVTFFAFIPQLRISRYDRKPLSSEDLKQSAVIEVTQRTWRTSMMNTESKTLTFPVPEDGNVHIKFQLQDQVVTLSILASILIYSTWNGGSPGRTVSLCVR